MAGAPKQQNTLPWPRLEEDEYDTYFDPAKVPALKRDYFLKKFDKKDQEKLLKASTKVLKDRRKNFPWKAIEKKTLNDIQAELEKNLYKGMPTPKILQEKIDCFSENIGRVKSPDREQTSLKQLIQAIKDLRALVICKDAAFFNPVETLHAQLKAFEERLLKVQQEGVDSAGYRIIAKSDEELISLADELRKHLVYFYTIWSFLKHIDVTRSAMKIVPFYNDTEKEKALLIHFDVGEAKKSIRFIWFPVAKEIYTLDANSDVIHKMNKRKNTLTFDGQGYVEEYLRFFCEHLSGEEGAFYLIEEEPSDNDKDDLVIKTCDLRKGENQEAINSYKAEIALPITSLKSVEKEDGKSEKLVASVVYGGEVFRVVFGVQYDAGGVGMHEDKPVGWCALRPLNISWDAMNSLIDEFDFEDTLNEIKKNFPEIADKSDCDEEDENQTADVSSEKKESFLTKPAQKWQEVSKDQRNEISKILKSKDTEGKFTADLDGTDVLLAMKKLTFYDDALLIHMEKKSYEKGMALRFILARDERKIQVLDGKSSGIHEFNAGGRLDVNEDTALEYLRFFCEHVHGEEGGFYPVEDILEEENKAFPACLDITARIDKASYEAKMKFGHPMMLEISETGEYLTTANILYGGQIFEAKFAVSVSGMVEMVDDEPITDTTLEITSRIWKPVDPDGANAGDD